MGDLTKEEQKAVLEKAMTAWLESKWKTFGKWAFRSLMAALFAEVISALIRSGWKP